MPIIKTLSKATKAERDKFRIPRSVQDAIPIRRIWSDGIFQVGTQFSKTFSFTDINYQIAGKEDKTSMFLDYSELLNALDSGASAKITIITGGSTRPSSRRRCCFLCGRMGWIISARSTTICCSPRSPVPATA